MKPPWLIAAAAALLASSCAREVVPSPEAVVARGVAITAKAFATLSGELQAAMAAGGVTNALSVCSEKAPRLTAEMAKAEGVVLRRVSHRSRNPANAADAAEQQRIADWSAGLAAGTAPTPMVELRPDGGAVFRAPILMAAPACLKCHGEPGVDIAPTDLERIRALYPTDTATGFKAGGVRGMWRVEFPAGAITPSAP